MYTKTFGTDSGLNKCWLKSNCVSHKQYFHSTKEFCIVITQVSITRKRRPNSKWQAKWGLYWLPELEIPCVD